MDTRIGAAAGHGLARGAWGRAVAIARGVWRRGLLAYVAITYCLLLCAACSSTTPAAPSSAATARTGAAAPSASPAAAASPATGAAGSAAAATPASGPLARVNFAYGQGMPFAPLYVAADKGYFRDEGLDVHLEVVGAGQDVLALTAAGQFDGTVVGLGVNFFNALARGLDIKYVTALGVSPADPNARPPSALVGRKALLDAGTLGSVADLRGRSVGLTGGAGGAASYQLHTLLAPAGLTLKDLNIANLDMPSLVIALTNGAVDAGVPAEPFLTQLESENAAAPFGGRLALDFAASGVLYGGSFIQNQRPAGEAFMRALVRASREMQGDRLLSAENVATYATYTGLPADTIRRIGHYAYPPNLTSHADRDLLAIQQGFMEEGLTNYPTPLPLQTLLDTSFLDAALARLGTYAPNLP